MPAAPGEFLRDSSDPQLQLLRDRAWQVHLLRGAKDYMVSRSTLLYTAATISPLVLAALEINGLNVRVWERSLGLNQRPAFGMPQPAPYDFLVEPGTDATVTRHGQQWKREHDVLGICAAIFQTIDGKASRHVTFAGLNVQAAANQLAVLVDAARDGLVDFAKLELQFSPRMAGIFEEAVALNREFRVRYRALTASQVAIAAAMFADHPAAMATSFLRHYILANTGADRFGTLITEWMTWYDKANSTNYDRWTQTLTAIVLRARHLSQQTRNRPEIAARHLIGALIASDRWAANSGVPALFAAADIDQRKLARTYLQYLTESPVDDTQPQRDDLEVWRTFLGFSTRSVVPRFNAEDLDGNDLLNVSANVEAFASLIASNHINPPLSIGLFGDWGSGKSFFMSKMREAIAKRALRATGRENSVFHQRIVQIDFNAWHYVEANLWASMVEHLFRNLKLTYEKPSEEAVSARREELLKQLDTMMAAKVAAEENVNKAVIARDQAALELEAQKKTADANAAAARNLRAKDVWEMVSVGPNDCKELQRALDKFGVGKVLGSVEDIRKTLDELRSVRTRMSLLLGWIVRQPASLVWLLAFLVLVPVVFTAVARLKPDALAAIGKWVSQSTVLITVATTWLAKRLASGKKLLDAIDSSRQKIDERLDLAAATIKGRIQSADTALADAAAAVDRAQQAVVAREQAVSVAKNELLKLTNGYRLNRFIDERAASDDYRKLLGVLATVRSDFATLSELMHPRSGKSDLKDELRIDRIILYIDDLDRCEPDRVIEVLQAVHLLLAFKLFVVVVGVDARWVSESLRQKHRALRGNTGRAYEHEDDVVGYAVEPHDYLEKIFQVPFWLDPLTPRSAGTYIENLLGADIPAVEKSDRIPSDPVTPGPGVVQSNAEQRPAREVLHTMSYSDDDDPESDPAKLTIEPKERDYMKSEEIARLVSRSPRTAKRFVNTYRFFRASIARDSLAGYLDETPPVEYRCALLMLAIVVGAPDVSLELFEQMNAANPNQRLEHFVTTIKVDDDHSADWKFVSEALEKVGKSENASLSDLLPLIDSVSRYSFRPPYKLKKPKKTAAKPEYLIRIKSDEREPPATPPSRSNTASPPRVSRRS